MLERLETETFLTLAEELHFGRTAERLRITTGRVSQVIKKLERRIGGMLFERTSRTVRLTPIGRQLADDLVPLVAAMDEALRRAADARCTSPTTPRRGGTTSVRVRPTTTSCATAPRRSGRWRDPPHSQGDQRVNV